MTETFFSGEEETQKKMNKLCTTILQASMPMKSVLSQSKTIPSTLNEVSEIIQPRDLSYDHASSVEEIFEVADE